MTEHHDPAVPTSGRPRVVLGVSGGIAAYKAAHVVRLFTEAGASVTVVPTESALRSLAHPPGRRCPATQSSTTVWEQVPQVNHVMLGQTADLVVVAPATANLLAKAAAGIADDLLTTTLLTAHGPVVMAPAMHTEMWQHAATAANVATLRARGDRDRTRPRAG
jgi:phosphopantothenoylcysteine decarboxylase/phosphopantothenate--cysteine ligase